jgi:hypothetical protein
LEAGIDLNNSPEGHIRATFSWILGIASNNEVKAYALYKGLNLAKIQRIEDLFIIGYYRVVLNQFREEIPHK